MLKGHATDSAGNQFNPKIKAFQEKWRQLPDEQRTNFEMHKQTAMLYTEESFNERGIDPLSLKHKQSGSALPKESGLII